MMSNILKTFSISNCVKVNFVYTLKGIEETLYYEKKKGYIHRKWAYSSNDNIKNPKSGEKAKLKIRDDKCKFIILVEESGLKPNVYQVFIEYDTDEIPEVEVQLNHVITHELVTTINKIIRKENEYIRKEKEYSALPEGVKNAITIDDLDFLNQAIKNNTWYRNQMERLLILFHILGTPLVRNWLEKLDIYSVSKKQSDLDSLAIYVASKLKESLPKTEREIIRLKLKGVNS